MKVKQEASKLHGAQLFLTSLALAITFTFAANLLVVTSGLIVGIGVGWASLPVSFMLACAALAFVGGRQNIKTTLIAEAIALVVIVAACAYEGTTFAFDYDGNVYHKLAIGLLNAGWNPFYGSADDFATELFAPNSESFSNYGIWIDHYGKATWMFASSIYAISGNIECGKAYGLLGAIAVFCIALPYLMELLDAKRSTARTIACVAISLLLSLNPITLSQMSSYYIDGFLASMLFVLIVGLTQLVDRNSAFRRRWAWSTIASAMLVLGNVKFTGLLYGGIFCIIFFVILAVENLRRNDGRKSEDRKDDSCKADSSKADNRKADDRKAGNRKATLKAFGLFAAIAVATVCWAGAPTYVMNFIQHGSPVYPLAGEGAVDIMSSNAPDGFIGQPTWYTLLHSYFGEMSKADAALKIPFTVTPDEMELASLGISDMRVSGFGPLFGGILILSMIAIVLGIIISWKRDRRFAIYSLVMTCTMLALLLGISESWWARYSPYVYLLPIIACVLAFRIGSYDGNAQKPLKIASNAIGAVLCILMAANSAIFLQWNIVKHPELSHATALQLEALRDESITLYYDPQAEGIEFPGLVFNLDDFGIDWEIAPATTSTHESANLMYNGMLRYGIN